MISFTGIDATVEAGVEIVWQDAERIFCNGWQIQVDGSKKPILAVSPLSTEPARDYLSRLAHEYMFRESLAASWALLPLELDYDRGLLALEGLGANPLASLIGPPMDIGDFLQLAVASAVSIGHMHANGFIHKDIKPGNLFTDPAKSQVWITGFGVASRAPRERQSPMPPEVMVGTFAYMAPEQTGRMNRSIDIRSDLYALGVTFYEMLTGSLPFMAVDPVEWMHCHIARQPISPSERSPSVPEVLSSIVLRLMAKAAEDRYQTAAGLQHDLQRCLDEWRTNRRIEPFRLGENDVSGHLQFLEKLYGREEAVSTLVSAFDRVVTHGAFELVLVSGYSGIGKSSVVNELQRTLVPSRGLFVSGKLDQYKRGIPHATLAQAFQGLVRQLLSKSDAELSRWKEVLTDALGANGQLVVNLVPELSLIVGEQPVVPELSGPEAQNRVLLVFQSFLEVFARQEHPVVLFLDDLQWLDLATLDFFVHLASQQVVKHLLLVGAYRNNEVGPTHPLTRRLEIVRAGGRSIHQIELRGILPENVSQMLAEALDVRPIAVEPLSRIIAQKTGGNPFFTIQFVGALADEGLLIYGGQPSAWHWDIEPIKARHVSDNVVDLMVERLSRLSDRSLEVVKVAACMGNSVEIAKLHFVLEKTEHETQDLLREALRAGLILQMDETYAFAHDRVQEAAYAMLSENERAEIHLHIGTRLLAIGESDIDEQIFEIVNQFNRGEIPRADAQIRSHSASLNLRAGMKAKSSSAFPAAQSYLSQGAAQLGDDGWTSNYPLAFALALQHAECTFLAGDLNAALALADPVLKRAATDIDKAAVYRLKVELHVVRSENAAAVQCGLAALHLFGINFPEHPEREEIEQEFNSIRENLQGRPIDGFADLPPMTDARMLVAMRVLAEIWPPSFFTDFNLTTLTVCRMVNISLLHGMADASNQGYALLGWIMGPALGQYEEGHRIVNLACDLARKRGAPLDMARVYTTTGLTYSWTQPLAASIEWFRSAYRIGVEAGDAYFACFSGAFIAMTLFQCGRNLHEDAKETLDYVNAARSTGFRDGADMNVVAERASACLRGLTRSLSDFSDDDFDQAQFEADLQGPRAPVPEWWYWTRKVMLHFLSHEYREALVALDNVQTGRCKIVQIQHLDYYFYGALAIASYLNDVSREDGAGFRQRLDQFQKQLEFLGTGDTFADFCWQIRADLRRDSPAGRSRARGGTRLRREYPPIATERVSARRGDRQRAGVPIPRSARL